MECEALNDDFRSKITGNELLKFMWLNAAEQNGQIYAYYTDGNIMNIAFPSKNEENYLMVFEFNKLLKTFRFVEISPKSQEFEEMKKIHFNLSKN